MDTSDVQAQLEARLDVQMVRVHTGMPTMVGIKRNDRWTYHAGRDLEAALQNALRALRMLDRAREP